MKNIFDKVKFDEFNIKSRIIRTGLGKEKKKEGF